MTTSEAGAQGLDAANLTIGDLAERTGVTPAVLRMWESRHGFPVPQRLASGHRRYAESDVAAVAQVLRRRDAGVRLEVAMAEVAGTPGAAAPAAPSVFAELRRRHPHLPVQRLRKRMLLALSWAIEDEAFARAHRALVLGAFQKERYYRGSAERWAELARSTRAAVALAEFGTGFARESGGPILVPLPERAPMRREWAVVCDGPGLTAALTAWELPGQRGVPDLDREFESVWTVEPRAVRDAARVCLAVATEHAAPGGDADELAALTSELRSSPVAAPDPTAASALLGRLMDHADRLAR